MDSTLMQPASTRSFSLPGVAMIIWTPSVTTFICFFRSPPGVKGTTQSDKEQQKPPTPPIPQPPEVPTVRVPYTEMDVPVPDGIVLTTAATTAVVSVAATLTATSLFKWLVTVMKPVFKTAWTKITKKKDSSNLSSSSGQPDS